MDEAWVAPIAAFVEFLTWAIDALDKLKMLCAQKVAYWTFNGLGTLKDDAAQCIFAAFEGFEVLEYPGLVESHLVVSQQLGLEW
jgi:hypothetical protein